MLRANPQPIVADDLRDFRDRTRGLEAEIAHDHERFVHQNPRPFLELGETDARIDVAIIIRATHDDVGSVFRRIVQICADAVRGRGDLLDDFLKLLDHLARFADGLLLRLNL